MLYGKIPPGKGVVGGGIVVVGMVDPTTISSIAIASSTFPPQYA
jgi:hypothetical protein